MGDLRILEECVLRGDGWGAAVAAVRALRGGAALDDVDGAVIDGLLAPSSIGAPKNWREQAAREVARMVRR